MRVLNVLLAATAATFIFCCADGAVASKRSLRSYDMNDLNNETGNEEERMIKLNSIEKVDELFGSPAKFDKIFDANKVSEAFAGGKKLDDTLDQATLDKLIASVWPKRDETHFHRVAGKRDNCRRLVDNAENQRRREAQVQQGRADVHPVSQSEGTTVQAAH